MSITKHHFSFSSDEEENNILWFTPSLKKNHLYSLITTWARYVIVWSINLFGFHRSVDQSIDRSLKFFDRTIDRREQHSCCHRGGIAICCYFCESNAWLNRAWRSETVSKPPKGHNRACPIQSFALHDEAKLHQGWDDANRAQRVSHR